MAQKKQSLQKTTAQIPPFSSFRDQASWEQFITQKLAPFEKNISQYLKFWYIESRESKNAYPSQGMLLTPFDFLPFTQKAMLEPEQIITILRVRQYFLELFNHPERIEALEAIVQQPFIAPQKIACPAIETLIKEGVAISIGDLGVS